MTEALRRVFVRAVRAEHPAVDTLHGLDLHAGESFRYKGSDAPCFLSPLAEKGARCDVSVIQSTEALLIPKMTDARHSVILPRHLRPALGP